MNEKYQLLFRLKDTADWNPHPFSEWLRVGENDENDLVLADGQLSGFHFEIRENPTGIYLKDVDAEEGETILQGESLAANRPTPLTFDQIFRAGAYEFKVVLMPEIQQEVGTSPIAQAKSAILGFGIWKTVGIGAVVVLLAVVGAILVYRNFIYQPQEIAESAATDVIEEVSEIINTLAPTELFEVASTAVVEAVDALATAPGYGEFELQDMLIDVSSMEVSDLMEFAMNPDQLMEMATTIAGDNVGFVYAYSGILKDGKVITTGMEFIEAPQEEMVDGVQVPDWDQAEIPVEILWKPELHLLSDGETEALALLLPTVYGADEASQIYSVEGIYRQKDGIDDYSAVARFSGDGSLIDVLTFGKVGSERQTPYKVNYVAGDTFTPYELEFVHDPEATEEMTIDLAGGSLPAGWSQLLQLLAGNSGQGSFQFGVGDFQRDVGTMLTLNENGLEWIKDESPEGDFFAGIAIEDLDGNFFVGYIPVLVKP